MKNEIMTFSPVDSELLLSEMDMMEVYGGTGDGDGTNTYCNGTRCTGIKVICAFHCGGGSGSGGSGSGGIGSGSGSGSGSGKGKGKGK